MFKSQFISVAALFVAPAVSLVSAQSGFLETQNFFRKGEVRTALNGYVHGKPEGKWSWSGFSSASETYSLAYAGPTFAPKPWCELSLSLGLETDPDPFRAALSLWLGKGKNRLFYIREDGGSGPWEKLMAVHSPSDSFGFGIFSQSFVGTGPYVEMKLGKEKKILLYGTYLFRGEDEQLLTGLRMTF